LSNILKKLVGIVRAVDIWRTLFLAVTAAAYDWVGDGHGSG
jgi:hypothetical protein